MYEENIEWLNSVQTDPVTLEYLHRLSPDTLTLVKSVYENQGDLQFLFHPDQMSYFVKLSPSRFGAHETQFAEELELLVQDIQCQSMK